MVGEDTFCWTTGFEYTLWQPFMQCPHMPRHGLRTVRLPSWNFGFPRFRGPLWERPSMSPTSPTFNSDSYDHYDGVE
jgi:hypothetical protein